MGTTRVSGSRGGQKRALDPQELELQMVVSHCFGAGNCFSAPSQSVIWFLQRKSTESPVLDTHTMRRVAVCHLRDLSMPPHPLQLGGPRVPLGSDIFQTDGNKLTRIVHFLGSLNALECQH